MLKFNSNINIRSRDFTLITGLPNKSQVVLLLAVSMSSAMSQTDCTREVSSAVTLTQIQLPSSGTQKEGKLSPDPSRYFDIYLSLTQVSWAAAVGAQLAIPSLPYHVIKKSYYTTKRFCSL